MLCLTLNFFILQTISDHFGEFLKKNKYEMLACCHDQGQFEPFKVFLRNDKKIHS